MTFHREALIITMVLINGAVQCVVGAGGQDQHLATASEQEQVARQLPAANREGFTTTSASAASTSTSAEQTQQIRALIEQLVFANRKSPRAPLFSPGVEDSSKEYRERYERCQEAFKKLSTFKESAFPELTKHLKDERESVHFRNHYIEHSVGAACYWNIYFQLQDLPPDYASYAWMRKGRDGKKHIIPVWEGTPFDEAGGILPWLDKNRGLPYVQKQIKCLEWLLAKETAIGACDEDSYFVSILPLEIRLLERRVEAGEDVAQQLKYKRHVRDKKLVNEIPAKVLPPIDYSVLVRTEK